MGPLAVAIANVISIICNVVQLLVLASVIVSLVGADPSNPIVQMIQKTTEPMYRPIRRLTSRIPGPLDWSPLVVILIVVFLQTVLVQTLMRMANS